MSKLNETKKRSVDSDSDPESAPPSEKKSKRESDDKGINTPVEVKTTDVVATLEQVRMDSDYGISADEAQKISQQSNEFNMGVFAAHAFRYAWLYMISGNGREQLLVRSISDVCEGFTGDLVQIVWSYTDILPHVISFHWDLWLKYAERSANSTTSCEIRRWMRLRREVPSALPVLSTNLSSRSVLMAYRLDNFHASWNVKIGTYKDSFQIRFTMWTDANQYKIVPSYSLNDGKQKFPENNEFDDHTPLHVMATALSVHSGMARLCSPDSTVADFMAVNSDSKCFTKDRMYMYVSLCAEIRVFCAEVVHYVNQRNVNGEYLHRPSAAADSPSKFVERITEIVTTESSLCNIALQRAARTARLST